MTPLDDRRAGILAGLGAYTLWGLFPLYFHELRAASATEIIAHRILWTFVVMSIVVVVKKAVPTVRGVVAQPRLLARVWLAGVLLSANWFTYVWAVNHDRVIDASMGYFINPIATVALGVVVLKETLTRLQVAAVGFGAAAVVVLVLSYGEPPWISVGLAATFSLYTLTKKRVNLDTVTALLTETTALVPLAVGLLVWFSLRDELALGSSGWSLDVRLVGLGVVTAVPLLFFGAATQRIPLVLIGLLQYTTPFAILLLGWLHFHEDMPPERWAGFSLIWAALACLTIDTLSARNPVAGAAAPVSRPSAPPAEPRPSG